MTDSRFTDRLALEQVDRDIFTGWCHAGAPLRAFGGQVAAQALVAATRTVENPERRVHSLHSYFLRPGSTTEHIVYLVDRIRDTGSFSTRRVRAVQNGEPIFVLSASYAAHEPGPAHQRTAPDVPLPAECPEIPLPHADSAPEMRRAGYPEGALLELRQVDPEVVATISRSGDPLITWVRTREPLPDDPMLHACTLTYFSDLTLVGTILAQHGGLAGRPDLMVASIDHAMWFHAPFRCDEWLLFVQDTPFAGNGHGLARGEFFDMKGVLVASAVQEALLRVRRPSSR